MIYLDRFLNDRSFLDILQDSPDKSTELTIEFLEHKFVLQKAAQKEKSLSAKEGNWVKREHDSQGKWITTWNQYCIWLKTFFRWLANKDEVEDECNWETPSFLQKIKSKKPLRDSPYEDSEIWERDEILRIVKYTDTRNQAIITLMWDLNAHNHEITRYGVMRYSLKGTVWSRHNTL